MLVAFASGYGYHRDELYFIAAGQHLDWAYADQGPLTPLIARAMTELSADSLTVLRLPSAIAAGLTVLLTGLLARELGGTRRAQTIAAACAGVGVIVLFTGHLLSTSTFDLLAWTAITWLVVRALRTGDDRLWLAAGAVLGVGLLNKPLPAFLAAGLLAGVAIAGPRRLLRNPYVWGGAAIALVLWLPWILWQADHDWPQIDVSRDIAAGGSTSSEPWWAVVPFQALLISPLLAPVWIAGLVALFRDPALRAYRFFAWTWVALAAVFMATGGKPYYLAGLLPLLLAVGSVKVDAWLERGAGEEGGARRGDRRQRDRGRDDLAAGSAGRGLRPGDRDERRRGGDDRLAGAGRHGRHGPSRRRRDPHGQLRRGRGDRALRAGPRSTRSRTADTTHTATGARLPTARRRSSRSVYRRRRWPPTSRAAACVARIDNDDGVDNDEQGAPVMVCAGPRRPWSEEWPDLRHFG